MWTVRLGQVGAEAHVGSLRDVAGVVVLDDQHVRRPQQPGQLGRAPGVIDTPAGLWARGWRNRATGSRSSAASSALGHDAVRRRAARPTASTPSWSRRSSSGGKVGFSTSTRSPSRSSSEAMRSMASMAPSTTVSASGGKAQVARSTSSSAGMHRIVEVARGHHLRSDPGQERAEVGEQLGVGGPGGEVEAEVAGPLGHPPVARRATRALAVEHERPEPPPALDGADAGERLPGLADGRRARAEAPGERRGPSAGGCRRPGGRR